MGKNAQWISIGEAAKYLGISRDTLRRWEKKGKIKPIRSPTNRRYYTKSQLENLMGGKKEKRAIKSEKRIGKMPKPIIVGVLSFLIAAILALFVQLFLLG